MDALEITYGTHPQLKGMATGISEAGGWEFSGKDGKKAYHMRNFRWIKEGYVAFTCAGAPRVYIVDDRKNDIWGSFSIVKPGDYVFVERVPGEGELIRMGGWDIPKSEIRPITREGLVLLMGREARPADMITHDEIKTLGVRWTTRAMNDCVGFSRDWGKLAYNGEFDCPCIAFRNGTPFLIRDWELYEVKMGKTRARSNGREKSQTEDDIQKYLTFNVENDDDPGMPDAGGTFFFRNGVFWTPEGSLREIC